jgi:hypothetical protein
LSIQVRTVIFDRSSSRGCPFDVRGIDEHDTTEMAGGIAVETPQQFLQVAPAHSRRRSTSP